MNCIICKQEIIVHWMQEIGHEPLEAHTDVYNCEYTKTKDPEPWPEYRCGCHVDKKPVISYDDFLFFRETDLFNEYGSGINVEPHYVAFCHKTHNAQSFKKLADTIESNDYEEVKKAMAQRLYEIYVEKDSYVANNGSLYEDLGEAMDTNMRVVHYTSKKVLDTADPQDRYTFDDDWIYYVENITKGV